MAIGPRNPRPGGAAAQGRRAQRSELCPGSRARPKPTALVAASVHAGVREALGQAFHSATLRVYGNDDIVGVEVGGAVKNVLAIATGLCDGPETWAQTPAPR